MNEASTLAPEILASTGSDGNLEKDPAVFSGRVEAVKKLTARYHASAAYAMLIDLGLHSGSKRFFLVHLPDGKVVDSGLVTHGSSPSYLKAGERAYSNVSGSLCSSVGVYKIGMAYQGKFGLAYKLHGLDSSNSNAFARAIVLHSHSCVPDMATEDPICQSWGCPTVSPAFLRILAKLIDASAQPILLSIFDSRHSQ